VQAGLRALGERMDAVVVVLADMPFVTAGMIATLLERYRATRAPAVVSRYGDVQAPPTLLDRSLFAEVLAAPGERCTREVVRRHDARAVVVAWPAGALRDVDVPADYEGARVDLAR
jgi:molybdenum cofactor cytidylyltransferase